MPKRLLTPTKEKQTNRSNLMKLIESYILQWVLPRYSNVKFDTGTLSILNLEIAKHIHSLTGWRVAACVTPSNGTDCSDLVLSVSPTFINQLSTRELQSACNILTKKVQYGNRNIPITQ